MARELNPSEVKEILSLKREDITSQKLKDFFAVYRGKDSSRFETNDTFMLLKGDFYNKSNIKTTIGRYIFNMFVLPETYLKKYGYYNQTLTGDTLKALQKQIASMILEDEASPLDYHHYLDYGEFLGMNTAYYLLPSMNYDINTPIPSVIKRRNELFKQYAKEIEMGDPNVADKIEKELLDLAKEELIKSKNPSYDFFAAKEFKFGNNYKKSAIMGGAFMHPSTGKIVISKANYADGIGLSDYPIFTNLTTAGAYARGVNTQDGGTETKRLNKSMQATTLDVSGSDCGTDLGVTVIMTESNKNMFKYRYMIDPSDSKKLIYLTSENLGQYVGKPIKLRSPLYCNGKTICSKCAGELFYKLEIPNAGLLTSTYSGILMNKSMKTMHDASIKFNKIDFMKYIKEK